ncbi:MAG: phosphodiester glycosidase family protein, partial [Actinomycetota bacterium]|nr:phosphodiester glycosidase family protein [Actinomycetota bacterium]
TQGTMRDGAATIVFYKDGSVQVGTWNADVRMTPDVLGARQNLDLIVDEGQVNPKITDNSGNRWGATLGNDLYVWRSGVGITASGALLYAAGPRLSADTLAQLLVRAGAVRAMELDINPSWTIFVHFAATGDGSVPNKLLATMQRPATTYDTPNSRDFIVARRR